MKKYGFTLIELLVVVAIIGILASIVVISLQGAQKSSRDAKRKVDLASVQTALVMYADKNGRYPATTTWQNSNEAQPWINDTSAMPITLVPDFISVLPLDPRNDSNWYRQYWYRSDSNGSNYKLMARGMESDEGRDWAVNDGGLVSSSTNRNWCNNSNPNASGCGVTYCRCDYELFTPGAQGW